MGKALVLLWSASPRLAVESALLVVAQAVIPLLSLFVLKLLVDSLTLSFSGDAEFRSFQPILILIFVAFAIAATGSVVSALSAYVNLEQTHRIKDLVLHEVQKKSVAMALEFYESKSYHDKLHRAQQEASGRPARIVQGLCQVGRSGLTLLGALALLARFHWGVMLALVGATLPVLYFRLVYAHKIYQWHRENTVSERMAEYLNHLLTRSDYAKEVRTFGFGSVLIERFLGVRARLREGVVRLAAQRSRKQVVTEVVAGIASFGSLTIIAHAAFEKVISLGDLVMYFGAFQVALAALRTSLQGATELYENNLYLSTLNEFLQVENSLVGTASPRPRPDELKMGLRFEGVSFRYPGTEKTILQDVDLAILPGETLALVGRNGSGKTTLAKLLCRLYDPTHGRITIEGIDIREFEPEEYRRLLGAFFQDFGRYALSARENIWLGDTNIDANGEEVLRAARKAEIHSVLESLPEGYETLLSRSLAQGQELSIGQWQKLALARVIVRNSPLVVLDEPTSFLDAAAEMDFFESFRELISGRSALIISHRFSTVKLADRVCVLENARIVEQGTHDDLIRLGRLYSELYQKQASYYSMGTHSRVMR